MAVFAYKAKDPSGQMIEGEVTAGTASEARLTLVSQKIVPMALVEKPTGGVGAVLRGGATTTGDVGKPKAKDLRVMTRQLGTLLRSGVPIVQALELISASLDDPNLKKAVTGVTEQVRDGKRLSEALTRYPRVFSRLFINMVRAGEEGGVMDTVLFRVADQMDREEKIRKKIMGAVRYPAIVMVIAFAVITGIIMFVIPKFKELFASNGKKLPGLTEFVINLSDKMVANALPIFGVLGVAIVVLVQYLRTKEGQEALQTYLLQVPLLGQVVHKGGLSRFARTTGSLLAAGVPILEALEIAASTVENKPIEDMILRMRGSVSNGRLMSQSLTNEPLSPPLLIQMVAVGEQSGKMDTMMERIADIYEEEVETTSEAVLGLLEPMMIVGVGGIIAVLVLAMYLPMFSMSGNIGG